MDDRPPSVSVVIPTFNRRNSLERTIDSVVDDPATAEVVVVVDGSTDGSLEFLDRLAQTERRVKASYTGHRGLNAAIQAGVERATSDIVLILDDDLEATPGLVSAHARHHSAAPNLALLGYSPVVKPGGSGAKNLTASLYGEAYERSCRSFEHRPQDILLHLYGGHMSIRRAECLRVGVYSAAFQERYHPDREFGIRCLKAGLVGRFDRSLVAYHHYERTLSEFRSDSRSQGAATAVLHELHPDLLGPVDPDSSAAGAPAAARRIIFVSRVRPAYRVVSGALAGIVLALGPLRMASLQRKAAKLLARVEHQRGLHGALAGGEVRPAAGPEERGETPTTPAS